MTMEKILQGDCRKAMAGMKENSVDAIVTDPPYSLGFINKEWDKTDIAYDSEVWKQCLRVLKPGGHLLAFGGTRTSHRMVCAIEDAGFEIRDSLCWMYGSGFPKSLDVSKAIDQQAGAKREVVGISKHGSGAQPNKLNNHEKGDTGIGYADGSGKTFELTAPATEAAKQWKGWGTGLKPAYEPIVLARKPISEDTIAKNILKWGTGALNIDACRIAVDPIADASQLRTMKRGQRESEDGWGINTKGSDNPEVVSQKGRWPANVVLDEKAAELLDKTAGIRKSGIMKAGTKRTTDGGYQGGFPEIANHNDTYGDQGGPSRFFYVAKVSRSERNEDLEGMESKKRDAGRKNGKPGGDNPRNRGVHEVVNFHPTVKPVALIQYLVQLVCPPKGIVLDPFLGSGTTGVACNRLFIDWIGIELNPEYVEISTRRTSGVDLFTQQGTNG